MDFKTECRKNLDPFLKYEIFFIDVDYDEGHYEDPKFVGNGIMGATYNNYYLQIILTELIL